jgi:hypothetical protein
MEMAEQLHELECLHNTLMNLSDSANSRDRVAEMLVVRQEVVRFITRRLGCGRRQCRRTQVLRGHCFVQCI